MSVQRSMPQMRGLTLLAGSLSTGGLAGGLLEALDQLDRLRGRRAAKGRASVGQEGAESQYDRRGCTMALLEDVCTMQTQLMGDACTVARGWMHDVEGRV